MSTNTVPDTNYEEYRVAIPNQTEWITDMRGFDSWKIKLNY